MENIEFGIDINIGGNVATAGRRASNALNNTATAVDNVGKSSQKTLGDLLAIQSSLFVIARLGSELVRFGFFVTRGIVEPFVMAAREAGEFERSLIGLRILTQEEFGTAKREILALAANTNLATRDVIDISRRFAGLGLTIKQMFTPVEGATTGFIENVAGALSLLSEGERTRAINRIANTLQRAQSVVDLFNISMTEAQRSAFNAGNTLERMGVVSRLLEERFPNVFQELTQGFLPAIERSLQLINVILSESILKSLEGAGAEITNFAELLTDLSRDEKFIKQLSVVFTDLVNILKFAASVIIDLISGISEIVKTNPGILRLVLTGILFLGVLTAISGAILLAEASFLLFRVSISRVGKELIANSLIMKGWNFLVGKTYPIAANAAVLSNARLSLSFSGMSKALLFTRAAMLSMLKTAGVLLLRLGLIAAAAFAVMEAFDAAPSFFDRFGQGVERLNISVGTLINSMILLGTIAGAVIGAITGFLVGGPIGAVLGAVAGGAGTFALLNNLASKVEDNRPDLFPGRIEQESSASDSSLEEFRNFGPSSLSPEAGERTTEKLDTLIGEVKRLGQRPINVVVNANVDGQTLFNINKSQQREEEERFEFSKGTLNSL